MRGNRLVKIAIVGLIGSVFLALRWSKIGESCLWFDEVYTVHASSQPWESMLSFISLDLIHPPLFYLLLKIWITAGGESVVWLRSLPVVAALFTFLPLYFLVRELKQNFTSYAIAITFLAFSGTFLKYSVEVRMYSLLACLTSCSLWLFVRLLNHGNGLPILLIVNILLVYTHYFGWLVIISQIAAAAIFDREKIFRVSVGAALTALAFLPWAMSVWNSATLSAGISQNIGWMTRPGIRELGTLALNLVEPVYYQTGSREPITFLPITLPLIILIVAMAGLVAVYWDCVNSETRRAISLTSIFTGLPTLSAFVISWLSPHSIWGTRHLIIVFVPFCVLLSICLAAVSNGRVRAGIGGIAGVMLIIAAAIQFNAADPRYAWCELVPLTTEVAGSGEPIYAGEDLLAYHLWFERGRDNPRQRILKLEGIDGMREDVAYFLPRGFDGVERVHFTALDENTFLLILRARELKESEPPLRNLNVKGYKISLEKVIDADGEQLGLYRLKR